MIYIVQCNDKWMYVGPSAATAKKIYQMAVAANPDKKSIVMADGEIIAEH